ncbi:hypothetical protein IF1G_07616 [Cordyceps javanica]|uniref:Uncharacterized protein n=1 Tax=Cordyceps javanica TaxID=43265 RepID=A0A545UWP5_9HYPO|nr:hypothetical protein IF1G_07616 [Cordyceps javanica]TQW04665.1 hypothetical protein IF2G_07894 [Cordyceps javanica]
MADVSASSAPFADSIPHRIAGSIVSGTQSGEDYSEDFRPSIVSALESQLPDRNEKGEHLTGLQSTCTSHSASRVSDGIKRDYVTHAGDSTGSSKQVLPKERPKFRAFVFSRQVSTFDAQSEAAANSPFHGFYNLFWLSVALLICKISANNWRAYGNPLGPSDILKTMFQRDGV